MTLQELLGVYNDPAPPTFGVPFNDIKKGMCKWPLNDTKPFDHFRMCGETTVDTLCPYCAEHERMAYAQSNGRATTYADKSFTRGAHVKPRIGRDSKKAPGARPGVQVEGNSGVRSRVVS